MSSELLEKLDDGSIAKEDLLREVKRNFSLLPTVIEGLSSSKATIRYSCGKVLMDLSETDPEKLYPYMNSFIELLHSKHRILVWNGTAIIANLARVDKKKKFDEIFDEYYALLNDEYLVTVANAISNSAKIALAKPYLTQKITNELLKTENLKTTPHLTEECKRVLAEKTINSFSLFFDKIEKKEKVILYAAKCRDSRRKTLKKKAEAFLSEFGTRK